MTRSLSSIKLNYVSTGTGLTDRDVWVELPGVGYSEYEKGLANSNSTQDLNAFIFSLDPRFAPDYTAVIPDSQGQTFSRAEEKTYRMLSTSEKSGVTLLQLSQNPDDATGLTNGGGYINYRDASCGPLPPGVLLGTGDEFYRIRFYQKLSHPVAQVSPRILIAAEVLIVYNPSATDSWAVGNEPNRTMHKNVRHIQWQGYSYKTPFVDRSRQQNVVHTSFQIIDVGLKDVLTIQDGNNTAPVVTINMIQTPWTEDAQMANTLMSSQPPASSSSNTSAATPPVSSGFQNI